MQLLFATPPCLHLLSTLQNLLLDMQYRMMDLFVGYDQCPLHPDSQDLMTFNSPMGPHWLTTVPMEYMNIVQIYQADMSFVL